MSYLILVKYQSLIISVPKENKHSLFCPWFRVLKSKEESWEAMTETAKIRGIPVGETESSEKGITAKKSTLSTSSIQLPLSQVALEGIWGMKYLCINYRTPTSSMEA